MQPPPSLNAPDSIDSLAIPRAESPLLADELAALPPREAALLREFAERGYVVIDLELQDFDALASAIIHDLAPRYPETQRRVDEAWYFSDAVRRIASAPAVLATLRTLYGREPLPFQTLNFDRGTEQALHSDTVHFHCAPRHFMCGVWAALEDVDADNGPLFVLPRSQALPTYDMTALGLPASESSYAEYERRLGAIVAASELEHEELHLKKGQAVIWAANLLHGGRPILDPGRTRHSQATHYYFEDCLYYFPMGSEPLAGKLTMREVIDLTSGRFVAPRHLGRELDLREYPALWTYERPLPSWVEQASSFPHELDEQADASELLRRVRALSSTVEAVRADARKIREDNREKAALLAGQQTEIEVTIAELQAGVARLEAQNERVRADNRAKQAFIQKRDGELAYKLARRVTKSWRALFGRRED